MLGAWEGHHHLTRDSTRPPPNLGGHLRRPFGRHTGALLEILRSLLNALDGRLRAAGRKVDDDRHEPGQLLVRKGRAELYREVAHEVCAGGRRGVCYVGWGGMGCVCDA